MTSLRVVAGTQPALEFCDPVDVFEAFDAPDAERAIDRAESALGRGLWIAGYLAYELGASFARLPPLASAGPLVVLGAFEAPRAFELPEKLPPAYAPPLARISERQYAQTFRALKIAIAEGDVYQVNYGVPFAFATSGDAFDLYCAIAARTQAAYQAYVEHDDRAILSWSPELFLEFAGGRIVTRPMKGTAPLDDVAQLHGEKNRAEHVMIVDLLRNDLHRICDDVRVESLFSVERYPAFATMTSTVAGRVRAGTSLLDTFRATFPCGSITGAPKRAAMSFIAAAETRPRHAFCGTVGYLSPQRTGVWNVAIRTAQLDVRSGRGRFDAGGGVVADSTTRGEWDEVLLKTSFLRAAADGFALLETFAGDAPPDVIALHRARLERSARAFGIDAVEAWSQKSPTPGTLVRVRVGIDGRASVTREPLATPAPPLRVCLAGARVDSSDPYLAHKTSWRPHHDAAARDARKRACFDALLCNERGELTEGSKTNLFYELDGQLYTPPLRCGLLPGILRGQLLETGRARERPLELRDLTRVVIYVGNSARGLLRAQLAA